MSGLANARKNFRWVLELDGANAFQIQECTLPTLELPVIRHGAPVNDPDSKSNGKLQVGQLILKKVKPALFSDTWAEDWMARAMLGDCWPSKIEPSTRALLAPGENIIDTITIECKYFYPTNSPEFAALFGAGLASGIAASLGSDIG